MAITLEGLKVTTVDIRRDETGKPVYTGNYELISSNGIVVAKQGMNGYQQVAVAPSPKTSELMHNLMQSISDDARATLGL